MNAHRSIVVHAVLAAALLAAAPAAGQDSREALKQRFEERYPALVDLKRAGKVGETWEGFLDAVEPRFREDPAVRAMLDGENRDRTALYALLAEDLRAGLQEPERSRMSPRVAAERNAWRSFERAGGTEKLRVAEGTWVTKSERPWLLQLLEAQGKGRLGETAAGFVAVVRPDAGDAALERIADRENEARRRTYDALARSRQQPVEAIAREQAKRYFRSAHLGVPLQHPDGRWAPKAPDSR
jgi:uncharacterized protein YdbL (DUF1318 family)